MVTHILKKSLIFNNKKIYAQFTILYKDDVKYNKYKQKNKKKI